MISETHSEPFKSDLSRDVGGDRAVQLLHPSRVMPCMARRACIVLWTERIILGVTEEKQLANAFVDGKNTVAVIVPDDRCRAA